MIANRSSVISGSVNCNREKNERKKKKKTNKQKKGTKEKKRKRKKNSLGNSWLYCNFSSLGTQNCPGVPLYAEHAE